jgi:hypothetical protein
MCAEEFQLWRYTGAYILLFLDQEITHGGVGASSLQLYDAMHILGWMKQMCWCVGQVLELRLFQNNIPHEQRAGGGCI